MEGIKVLLIIYPTMNLGIINQHMNIVHQKIAATNLIFLL
jgi:hypothetical protein